MGYCSNFWGYLSEIQDDPFMFEPRSRPNYADNYRR